MEQLDTLFEVAFVIAIFAVVIGLFTIIGAEIGYGPIDRLLKNLEAKGLSGKNIILILVIVLGGGLLILSAIYFFIKSKFEEVKGSQIQDQIRIEEPYA